MNSEELTHLVEELREQRTDHRRVEAKTARAELPKGLWKTVSAFGNTAGGGTILLGVSEEDGFAVTGVRNAAKLQADLASLCERMEPRIQVVIDIVRLERRQVVVAQVPEAPASAKPCYYRPSGIARGAYVRVGDGNRRLDDYEVGLLLRNRAQPDDDRRPVPGASRADLDDELVKAFVARSREHSSRLAALGEQDVLVTRSALVDHEDVRVPTVGGLLALGRFPQQHLPGTEVTVAVYPTSEGVADPSGRRFLDSATARGPLPEMRDAVVAVLHRNLRLRVSVSGAARADEFEIPDEILREAVANALVHRDLHESARTTPVRVELYPDRLVIWNPGGLYGPISLDRLGQPGIAPTRNRTLVDMLEDVLGGDGSPIVENRGTGIRAMRQAAERAGLPPPEFADGVGWFQVTVRRPPPDTGAVLSAGSTTEGSTNRSEQAILDALAGGPRTRRDLQGVTGLGASGVTAALRRLRRRGLVEPTTDTVRSRATAYRLTGR